MTILDEIKARAEKAKISSFHPEELIEDVPRLVKALEKAIRQRNSIHLETCPKNQCIELWDAELESILKGKADGGKGEA